jgi:hypothetical protein
MYDSVTRAVDRRSLAGTAVDELAHDVEMAGVAGILLEHVEQDRAERRPHILRAEPAPGGRQLGQVGRVGDLPGAGAAGAQHCREAVQCLGLVDVPAAGAVVAPRVGDGLGTETPDDPPALHVGKVLDERERRPPGGQPRRAQLHVAQPGDPVDDRLAEEVEVAEEQPLGVVRRAGLGERAVRRAARCHGDDYRRRDEPSVGRRERSAEPVQLRPQRGPRLCRVGA